MHKSQIGNIVIDCKTDDLHQAATFWASAFGYRAEQSDNQVNAKYIRLETPDGDVQVMLQKVIHPSRVHLDIETDDIEAETKRLESLGAKKIERLEKWTVMEAPSGHRFCIVGAERADFEEHATSWT